MNAQNLKLHIKAITDFSDVQSNVKNVQQVLEKLKLPVIKKTKSGYSTDKAVLEKYKETTTHEEGAVVYDIYTAIGNKNYLKLDVETDVDLVGFINYYNFDNQDIRSKIDEIKELNDISSNIKIGQELKIKIN